MTEERAARRQGSQRAKQKTADTLEQLEGPVTFSIKNLFPTTNVNIDFVSQLPYGHRLGALDSLLAAVQCSLAPSNQMSDGTARMFGALQISTTVFLTVAKFDVKSSFLTCFAKGCEDVEPTPPFSIHFGYMTPERFLRAAHLICNDDVSSATLRPDFTLSPGRHSLTLASPYSTLAVINVLRQDPPTCGHKIDPHCTYFGGHGVVMGSGDPVTVRGFIDRGTRYVFGHHPMEMTVHLGSQHLTLKGLFDGKKKRFSGRDECQFRMELLSNKPLSGRYKLCGCRNLGEDLTPQPIDPIELDIDFTHSAGSSNSNEMIVSGEGKSESAEWTLRGTFDHKSRYCTLSPTPKSVTPGAAPIELEGCIECTTGDGLFRVVGTHDSSFLLRIMECPMNDLKELATSPHMLSVVTTLFQESAATPQAVLKLAESLQELLDLAYSNANGPIQQILDKFQLSGLEDDSALKRDVSGFLLADLHKVIANGVAYACAPSSGRLKDRVEEIKGMIEVSRLVVEKQMINLEIAQSVGSAEEIAALVQHPDTEPDELTDVDANEEQPAQLDVITIEDDALLTGSAECSELPTRSDLATVVHEEQPIHRAVLETPISVSVEAVNIANVVVEEQAADVPSESNKEESEVVEPESAERSELTHSDLATVASDIPIHNDKEQSVALDIPIGVEKLQEDEVAQQPVAANADLSTSLSLSEEVSVEVANAATVVVEEKCADVPTADVPTESEKEESEVEIEQSVEELQEDSQVADAVIEEQCTDSPTEGEKEESDLVELESDERMEPPTHSNLATVVHDEEQPIHHAALETPITVEALQEEGEVAQVSAANRDVPCASLNHSVEEKQGSVELSESPTHSDLATVVHEEQPIHYAVLETPISVEVAQQLAANGDASTSASPKSNKEKEVSVEVANTATVAVVEEQRTDVPTESNKEESEVETEQSVEALQEVAQESTITSLNLSEQVSVEVANAEVVVEEQRTDVRSEVNQEEEENEVEQPGSAERTEPPTHSDLVTIVHEEQPVVPESQDIPIIFEALQEEGEVAQQPVAASGDLSTSLDHSEQVSAVVVEEQCTDHTSEVNQRDGESEEIEQSESAEHSDTITITVASDVPIQNDKEEQSTHSDAPEIPISVEELQESAANADVPSASLDLSEEEKQVEELQEDAREPAASGDLSTSLDHSEQVFAEAVNIADAVVEEQAADLPLSEVNQEEEESEVEQPVVDEVEERQRDEEQEEEHDGANADTAVDNNTEEQEQSAATDNHHHDFALNEDAPPVVDAPQEASEEVEQQQHAIYDEFRLEREAEEECSGQQEVEDNLLEETEVEEHGEVVATPLIATVIPKNETQGTCAPDLKAAIDQLDIVSRKLEPGDLPKAVPIPRGGPSSSPSLAQPAADAHRRTEATETRALTVPHEQQQQVTSAAWEKRPAMVFEPPVDPTFKDVEEEEYQQQHVFADVESSVLSAGGASASETRTPPREVLKGEILADDAFGDYVVTPETQAAVDTFLVMSPPQQWLAMKCLLSPLRSPLLPRPTNHRVRFEDAGEGEAKALAFDAIIADAPEPEQPEELEEIEEPEEEEAEQPEEIEEIEFEEPEEEIEEPHKEIEEPVRNPWDSSVEWKAVVEPNFDRGLMNTNLPQSVPRSRAKENGVLAPILPPEECQQHKLEKKTLKEELECFTGQLFKGRPDHIFAARFGKAMSHIRASIYAGGDVCHDRDAFLVLVQHCKTEKSFYRHHIMQALSEWASAPHSLRDADIKLAIEAILDGITADKTDSSLIKHKRLSLAAIAQDQSTHMGLGIVVIFMEVVATNLKQKRARATETLLTATRVALQSMRAQDQWVKEALDPKEKGAVLAILDLVINGVSNAKIEARACARLLADPTRGGVLGNTASDMCKKLGTNAQMIRTAYAQVTKYPAHPKFYPFEAQSQLTL